MAVRVGVVLWAVCRVGFGVVLMWVMFFVVGYGIWMCLVIDYFFKFVMLFFGCSLIVYFYDWFFE